MNGQLEPTPSVGDALARVFRTGQRLIVDRIDLAVTQVGEAREQVTEMAVLVLCGAVALVVAWVALNWALVRVLSTEIDATVALLISAAINIIAGGILLRVGLKHRIVTTKQDVHVLHGNGEG